MQYSNLIKGHHIQICFWPCNYFDHPNHYVRHPSVGTCITANITDAFDS
ncbi:hypothetical protein SLEP1_g55983 [Rubroshorea leprosula]|uniref:Uncharacterized protein n=1 Tax=Rubroshorea leprosula TaxID=152421 RepID=A0AAV5MH12_9ROSI|nr:hypothetical protein SLEP1_g55983 [Rubroshorea leprosula]